jgi:rhodanese-related sulfurtransferase
MPATCTPQQASDLLAADQRCQLIDVREFVEYAAGHAPQARLIPLGQLDRRSGELDRTRPVVILCKSGKRAAAAADKLAAAGFEKLSVVQGGTDAWIAAGLPVDKIARRPWSLERQVRLAAGILIIAGLFIPPWPFLSAFVGAGLAFAALTNTCGMAMLLARMPWNREHKNATCCTT